MDKVVLGSLILFATACGGVGGSQPTSSTAQAATAANGLFQNGLTTNGVYQNGVYQNGVYQNGVYQNGVYQNGVYQNGVYQNGVYQNGVYQNGVYQNGVYQNGVYQNGVYQNGVYQNGVYQNGVYQNGVWQSGLWSNPVWQVGSNADALRTNSYTRQFFQYVYACAMPGAFDPSIGPPTDPDAQLAPGKYSTSLDPNNGTLACNASGGCDDPFYTCAQATNTCVVPLQGAVGVGVNADGSTWWGSGKCDETCQRWVSACVLARTNAYGIHVDISMRAPADAPPTIKNALAVDDIERANYSLREGAYYGNVFDTTPVTPPSDPSYSGDPGQLVATPQFYACAGPGSNIPEITKRFCSSQGDQTVIKVPGTCLATGPELATCAGEDLDTASPTFGAINDCYASTSWAGLTPYAQVITVFLKNPVSVCGNAVCEAGEETSCPSDCHPGTWAKDFSELVVSKFTQGATANFISAVGPDDSIVVAGGTTQDLDLGGGLLPATDGYGVAIKFDSRGNYVWGTRFGATLTTDRNSSFEVGAIYIASSGTISLAGTASGQVPPSEMWLGSFSSTGTLLATHFIDITTGAWVHGLALDSHGDALIAGETFGQLQIPGAGTSDGMTAFVAKVSASGVPRWAQTVTNGGGGVFGRAVIVDAGDNAVFLAENSAFQGTIYKICSDGSTGTCGDGTNAWTRSLGTNPYTACGEHFYNIALDANGNVYATGNASFDGDLGGGPLETADALNNPPVVVKYDREGNFVWQNVARIVCPGGATFCGNNPYCLLDPSHGAQALIGVALRVAPDGTVVVASIGNSAVGGGIDFGTGVFPTYSANDIFIAAYAPDSGATQWAKQIPMIASSSIGALSIDSNAHVIVSGGYAGSLEFDDQLLVTRVPEAPSTVDWFLAAFGSPPPDTTPPVIGQATDSTGTLVNTIPHTITLDATSSTGAVAFFMPPTAIDSANSGTNVSCSPPPNTIFPIGTTHVTCTATDPRGNASSAGFDIVVKDRLAPTLTGVPADMTSTDPVVTYTVPTASDQVDGTRPVTCTPPSGSTFAAGTTTVTCTAADNSSNTIQASFEVTVSAPQDSTPPVITVPAALSLEATGPAGAIATFAASASDDVDGTDAVACIPASGATFPIGVTTVACTSRDAAGNTATKSFAVTVRDTTAPQIAVPANITTAATTATGAPVTFPVSAIDAVDGTVPVSCSKASGSAFALGATTVTCSARDAHGNASTRTFTVTVQMSWSGVLLPINADGSAEFKLGSIVPVRFDLAGASASITNAVATVTFAKLSSTISGTRHKLPRYLLPTGGTTAKYNPLTHNYYFRYDTSGLSPGTYIAKIDFHDGVVHTTQFSLGSFSCGACDNDGGDN